MVRKIKLPKSTTDDDLLNKAKEVCGVEIEAIAWTDLANDKKIQPQESTVAIVVDIKGRGAINILETSSDAYVDGVGTEDAKMMVVVPWDSSWWLFSIGTLRLGYFKAMK